MCHKAKRRLEDYKNVLEVAQIENKIKHLEKIKLMWVVLKNITKN